MTDQTTREEAAQADLATLVEYAGHFADSWSTARRQAWVAAVADRVRHEDGTHSFGPSTPVPAWARLEFDGRLRTGECPILSLGTVPVHVDWPRIVREHQVEMANGFYETAPYGPDILSAFELLTGLGYEPWLDTELHLVDVAEDGTLQIRLEAGALYAEDPVLDRTVREVWDRLGSTERVCVSPDFGGRNVVEWAWY
ncbi:hypothetical protein F7Q99_38790 [Streptomyces kaniharaensis]|uniref:Uncharacterized protein n=1 Tax=Streptomyces kaniharaensis TaxID=212423 RepID=A0A6N7L4U7_9ACTN|nr:hypothetical protein [Streptomyces kaniharaensis]MQS17939.1 hypothetical protein [Streptomyces kaniharaensis]MQS17981.1 hypothetical protein [Streptomyces kaniharaensis]